MKHKKMIGVSEVGFTLLLALTFFSQPPMVQAGSLVLFQTTYGEMAVELFDQEKPVTVQNFKNYVSRGLYKNVIFHRCLPSFIAQSGGIRSPNRTSSDNFTNFVYVANLGAITNEYAVGRRFSNTYGTIAMAKLSGDPNSATSQWFFNLADNSANLDNQNGGFTVFGRVVSGTNVLNQFNSLQLNGGGIVDLTQIYGASSTTALFANLPVLYTGMTPPHYNDLIYADISLFSAQVALNSDGSRTISWTSIGNRLNHVEYAGPIPFQWQVLTSVTGTGGRMEVKDSGQSSQRLYRVRLEYP